MARWYMPCLLRAWLMALLRYSGSALPLLQLFSELRRDVAASYFIDDAASMMMLRH